MDMWAIRSMNQSFYAGMRPPLNWNPNSNYNAPSYNQYPGTIEPLIFNLVFVYHVEIYYICFRDSLCRRITYKLLCPRPYV